MNSQNKTTVFSVFALGLIGVCFVLLLQEVVLTRQHWAEIPRIFGGLLAPVPLAIFLAFCFAHRSGKASGEPSASWMSLFLAASIALTIGIGLIVRGTVGGETEVGTGPVIAESSVFSASVLNVLFLRSPFVASLLSGISIGLTFFVIFLI